MISGVILVIIMYIMVLNTVNVYRINRFKMICIQKIKTNDIVIKLIQKLYSVQNASLNKYNFEYIICNQTESNIILLNYYIMLFLPNYRVIKNNITDISLNNYYSLNNLYNSEQKINNCIIYKFHLQK